MTQQLQIIPDIHSRVKKTQSEIKDIKAMFKDALSHHSEYGKIIDEIKTLRDKKAQIENAVKEDFGSEFSTIKTLQLDLDNDKMLMSDAALNKLMQGESINFKDEKGIEYEGTVSVKYKKIKWTA